jgi:hypothetical protein
MWRQVYAASSQEHVCTAESCPEPGSYYVSCIDGASFYLMAGPYGTHALALADVDKALHIADARDGRAWFMAWGTVRLRDGSTEPGRLNKHNLL